MSHNYQTFFASQGNLKVPSIQTISSGKNAFVCLAIRTSDIQKKNKRHDVEQIFISQAKIIIY